MYNYRVIEIDTYKKKPIGVPNNISKRTSLLLNTF